ncbi:hypothetical protein KRMM14A1259_12510 [Krasilnikovia sp. MM14-A1259]
MPQHREPAGYGTARPAPATVRAPRHAAADRPFIVIWEATQACPLACRHCRASARPWRDVAELSTDEATDLMAQVAAFGDPPPLFVITGGDPFQRPDLMTLVRRGSELGLPVSVSPSGTPTLTRTALADLHDAGARAISLSVDAAGPVAHDAFRGVAGVYAVTARAWKDAIDLGLKVQINTTVTRDNVADLPDIAAQVRDRGVLLWSVFFLVPTGRGRTLHELDAQQTEDVLHLLYDIGLTVPVKTTEAHHFRRVYLQRSILDRRGVAPEHVLHLGPLYHRLRRRLDELGLLRATRRARGDHRCRSAPETDSSSSPTAATCIPAASCRSRRATYGTGGSPTSTAPHRCSARCVTPGGCAAGAAPASSVRCAVAPGPARTRSPARSTPRNRPARTSPARSRSPTTWRRCCLPDHRRPAVPRRPPHPSRRTR